MPQFTETRTPYEFLVRWDEQGKLQGAHVQYLETTRKDGAVIAQTITPAAKVAVVAGDTEGFKLGEIVGQLVLDQQQRLDELTELLALKDSQIEELRAALGKE